MPMLLIDDRMEVVRVNSSFREYCKDLDEALPNNRFGTLLKCVNAPLELEGCGNSPACDSCTIMRALREVLRSGLPARGETSDMVVGSNGSSIESWLLYCVEAAALDGQIHALMSFMDISECKRDESMRQAKAEEFRALMKKSHDAIARYDRCCSRVYVNPAMEGSVIRVYLPISEGNRLSQHSSSEFETAMLYGHETVLLVDDDPEVLRITSEILVQYGYRVLTAVDGLEALGLFEEYREEIKAAVIDMIMPRMNGREAIKQMRKQAPDLPIILASGYTDDIVDSAAIDALNVVFLPKPVDHRKLVAAIRSGLGG